MAKFYVTCAIPYVNAPPHVGHALEFVQGDVIARYHALLGEETRLLSGGDENALKNVQAAEKAGISVATFIDTNTQKFLELTKALGCRFDTWQKGSDKKHHFTASQKLWNLCKKDIFKKSYEGLYCVGCEQFYTPDELDANGECFEHPGKKLEMVKEENYFFRLSKYQDQLITLITDDTIKIIPDFRKNEMLSFLKQPLLDISISRSNERAKNWGVPVPEDDTQRMYVWFDALNIYQSGIGFGWDEKEYNKWWPADVHVIGKGITRFHAIYWPAFLLSAGLKLPKSIFVHGYFTVNGQKMSKTVGNVIDPFILIKKYGADPLRFVGARRHFRRDASHPEIVYEPGKCILCGACVAVAAAAGERLGLAIVGRGFEAAVAVPLKGTMIEGLPAAARRAAEVCPTGAFVLKSHAGPPHAAGPCESCSPLQTLRIENPK